MPRTNWKAVRNYAAALALCAYAAQGAFLHAAEQFSSHIQYLYPTDLTLYGMALDANDPSHAVTLQVKACWDDPSFTHNCVVLPVNTNESPFGICSGATCKGFQYLMPTGTVGSVTPRDGNHHLIYLKVLSQQNPGAGDFVIDGSPYPFTYAHGTVDRTWPLTTESSPSRLTAAQLAIFANSQDPYSVGAHGATVCTVGGTAIKNDGVVGYYAQKRAIPCANIRVMSFPVPTGFATSMTEATFDATILPAIQSLPGTIQAIAVGWVAPGMFVPANNSPGHDLQSLLDVIAHGGVPATGTDCMAGIFSQTPYNPYFNSASKTPFTDYGFRPAMFLAGAACPACTSTNNYGGGTLSNFGWNADFPTIKNVIDAAAAATDTNPTGGVVYWAETSDLLRSESAYTLSDNVLGSPSAPNQTLSPRIANALRLGSFSNPLSTRDVSAQNILAYENSAPNWNYRSPTFLSGAGIGWSLTSTSGAMPDDGSQTPVLSWLNQGAVAAYGSTVEPCDLYVQKTPDATILVPNYTQGQTAIEALWKSVRITNNLTVVGDPLASPFSLTAGGTTPPPSNKPPTVATAASITPSPVTGTTAALSVLGADDGTEPLLTYTWATTGTPPAAVSFSANGTNSAKNTTVTFSNAGTYNFQVTIRDAGGLTVTSSVNATVNQTLTGITLSPSIASVGLNGTQLFTTFATDQFNKAMTVAPTFTWSVSGGGSINAGLFTAGVTAGGPFTVTATANGKSGSAPITIVNQAPTVATAATASPSTVSGVTTALSVLGADDGLAANLTYTWGTTGTPPGGVTFSVNGTNAAKATTVTFAKAGSYTLQVTIKDAGGLTAASSVNVTVNQTLTAINVSPAVANVPLSGTQSFSATGTDQFNQAMSPAPGFTWSVSGGGSISGAGLFSAGTTPGGPFTVTAASGGTAGTAAMTVTNTVNLPPVVVNAAAAASNPVTTNSVALSVLGSDPGGPASGLTYTWGTTGTPPAGAAFSVNGTNAAKNTTVTFFQAGSYSFQVTIQEPGGLTVASSVNVTVNQTLTGITVSPPSAAVQINAAKTFSASGTDQFNHAMSVAPTFNWTTSGGGAISGGLFTAGNSAGGPFTITAAAGGITGTAGVTVTATANLPPTLQTPATATPNPVTDTSVALSVLGTDPGGPSSGLTYTWGTSGNPPAGVSFSANGTNAAQTTLATFSAAGTYTFLATIQEPGGLTVTSSVNVTVNETLTDLQVNPFLSILAPADSVAFIPQAADQFGQNIPAPTGVTWSVSGGGTITNSGVFTAGITLGGPFIVTATSGGLSGTALIFINPPLSGGPPSTGTAPTLDWPAVSPINSTLQVSWPLSLSVTGLTWIFTPMDNSASPGSPHSGPAAAAPGTISFSTQSGAMTPGRQGLTPGTYQVTVLLLQGNTLISQGTRAIALVNAALSNVKVYPNPWRADKHAGKSITFDGLTVGATIKIFTLSAHEVKDLEPAGPTMTWDLTDDSGDKVASGIYLYLITDSQGGKVTGKLAIIK